MVSYIVGFPKEYSENMELKLVDQIIPTKFCKAYKNYVDFPVYESQIEKDCINEQTFCRVSLSYNLSPEFKGGKFYKKFDKPLKRINLQKNAKILSVNEINDCINKVNLGYTITNKIFEIKNPIPIFSVILFSFLLFSVVLKEYFQFFIIRRKKIEK